MLSLDLCLLSTFEPKVGRCYYAQLIEDSLTFALKEGSDGRGRCR